MNVERQQLNVEDSCLAVGLIRERFVTEIAVGVREGWL